MKLTCTQENFKKAIYSTERVVGKQITLPILENILLETDHGMLKISATNLEIGVFLKIGAKIEQEGAITVPAKLLSNFVNNLPSESTVSLEVKDQTLFIESGSSKAQIKGLGSQDFPIIPEMDGDFLFSLPAQETKEAIPKLSVCVSLDSSRPELTGFDVVLEKDVVRMAATDSFRLAEAIIELKKTGGQAYDLFLEKTNSVIVPLNTFLEVFRVIGNDTQEINVGIEESQIFFQVDNVRIVSRLINGKYPEYRQIIPQKFATKVLLEKDSALRAVKIAGVFTSNKTGEVMFNVNPVVNSVTVASRAEEVGENSTVLDAEIDGQAQEAVFNPKYMADGLGAIATPKFFLLMNSGASAAVIRMATDKKEEIPTYTYIIMPIKN
ncbi:MAG TPA: DNA polymerase III subunit beta [Candidatus Moranbacteria bacterium]|jgi:DNA polymerase-3 subunit beta|nr:DNA polymerase III subunit beta [Candidatus Moranbacteria bacterium]HPX94087.1 DNA polymerase III subunit beta [Candidatus Moranbacteria bacterium]HQB59362.1 DNA polymerase III subunit beta [Candidatus Moranbacteria bacterium]